MEQHTTTQEKRSSLWEGASLVAGTAIGGGMLAIPLFTFEGGLVSAGLASVAAWACLTSTGLALCRVLVASPGSRCWVSLVRHWCGEKLSALVAMAILLFLWLLLVAYCAGGASLFASDWLAPTLAGPLFLAPLVVSLAMGRRVTARLNSALFSLLLLCAGGLVLLAGPLWNPENVLQGPFEMTSGWWKALPVLFAAFGFHAVLPSLAQQVGPDVGKMSRCVLLGTTVALGLILSWQALVFGCLGRDELEQLALLGRPVTCALGERTSWAALFSIGSMLFATFAIATSFLGVAQAGLDLLGDTQGRRRWLVCAALVSSAWIASLWDPALFGKALSLAGGLGVSLLNGVLPVGLLLLAAHTKRVSIEWPMKLIWAAILGLCLVPMIVEILPRLG